MAGKAPLGHPHTSWSTSHPRLSLSSLVLLLLIFLGGTVKAALVAPPFTLHADSEASALKHLSSEDGPLGVRRLLLDMTGPEGSSSRAGIVDERKHIIIFSQGQAGSLHLQRALESCVPNATVIGERQDFWPLLWLGFEAWSSISHPELRPVGWVSFLRGQSVYRDEVMDSMTEIVDCMGCQRNETGYDGSWWRELTEEDVLMSYRQLLKQQQEHVSGSRVLGLKQPPAMRRLRLWRGRVQQSPGGSSPVVAVLDRGLQLTRGFGSACAPCWTHEQQGQWPRESLAFARYATFLRLLWPGALVVSAVRRAEELERSGWWEDEDLEALRGIEATLRGYTEAHPDHAHMVTYGGKRVGQEGLQRQAAELSAFLGEPLDAACYQRVALGRGGAARQERQQQVPGKARQMER